MAVLIIKIFNVFPMHIWVAISAWVSRLFCAGMNLLIVPLVVKLLGVEGYEIFVLSGNLLAWYMLLDVGIGVSLQNFISESRVKCKNYESYIYLSGITAMIFFGAGLLFAYFSSSYISSIWLKKYAFLSTEEQNAIFLTVSVISIINAMGSIMLKIWYGEQKGYISNIMPAMGAFISSITLFFVYYYKISIEIWSVLFIWMFPTAIISSTFFMIRIYKIYRNTNLKITKKDIYSLLKRARPFGFFAVVSAATLQIDYLIMSQYVVGNAISVYNIATKLYVLSFFAYLAVLMAAWPVFTEELNRGNWKKVLLTIKKYLMMGIFLISFCIAISLMFMPKLVDIFFSGNSIIVPNSFIILLGVYYMIRVWTDLFAVVLQSISDMKVFSIAVPVQAVISIVSQYALVESYQIYGIVIGLIFSYLCTTFWCLPYQVYRRYKKRSIDYAN